MTVIKGTVLSPGTAQGPVLVLDDALSFWGAFNPRTGEIIDQHHPQRGELLTDRILVLPASRGSGGTPGGIAEAIRRGTGPTGIILGKGDINLAIGSFVAGQLYGKQCPVISVKPDEYKELTGAKHLQITEDGTVTSLI